MAKAMSLPVTVEIQLSLDGMVVEPGDMLVIRVNRDCTMAELEEIKARLAELLPGVRTALLGVESIAVVKGGKHV